MSVLAATSYGTWPDLLVFFAGALVILAGAVGVVMMANPVHSALMLVLTLFGVALLFIEQNAQFLFAVQIIVYAGAIVVLFLFVIMFLGVDRQENLEIEPLRGQRPLAVLLTVVALGGILTMGINAKWVTGAHNVSGSHPGTNVAQIGRSVFTTYLFAFEATAALLVIAVVGAVVLARRPPTPALGDEEADAAEVAGVAEVSGAPGGPGSEGDGAGPGGDEEAPMGEPEEVGS